MQYHNSASSSKTQTQAHGLMRLARTGLIASLVAALLLTAGCASNEEKEEVSSEKIVYQTAQRYLRTSFWDQAIKSLQLLEEHFPFGSFAEQAQLELIYAYHMNGENDAAITAADRFIRLHPQHRNVDYAYYMKGIASFNDSKGLFDDFLPMDKTSRDPGAARESFAFFAQLVNRFPDSQYTPDAQKRMTHLRNLLARSEINVANYYFTRGAFLAAANRGRYVVENFQQTPAVPDALAVMVQAYHNMGLDDMAEDIRKVLAANYPQHPSLDASGNFKFLSFDASDRSWINRATFGLIDRQVPPKFDSREIFNPEYQRHESLADSAIAVESPPN